MRQQKKACKHKSSVDFEKECCGAEICGFQFYFLSVYSDSLLWRRESCKPYNNLISAAFSVVLVCVQTT